MSLEENLGKHEGEKEKTNERKENESSEEIVRGVCSFYKALDLTEGLCRIDGSKVHRKTCETKNPNYDCLTYIEAMNEPRKT